MKEMVIPIGFIALGTIHKNHPDHNTTKVGKNTKKSPKDLQSRIDSKEKPPMRAGMKSHYNHK